MSLLSNAAAIQDKREKKLEMLDEIPLVYLISHDHAPDKLLAPAEKDISHEYHKGFLGMTEVGISLETLISARRKLIEDIRVGLTEAHKAFLLSFYRREPQWDLLAIPGVDQLPAVKWRELNLDRAGKDARVAIFRKLEEIVFT